MKSLIHKINRNTYKKHIKCNNFYLIILISFIIGVLGAAPHILFSLNQGEICWFWNSYDEGFYSQDAVSNWSCYRLLSRFVMRLLTGFGLLSLNHALIISDFILPSTFVFVVGLVLRRISQKSIFIAFWLLIIPFSSDILGFKNYYFNELHPVDDVLKIFQASLGDMKYFLFPLTESHTRTPWVYRTPEPQVSWIMASIFIYVTTLIGNASTRQKFKWSQVLFIITIVSSIFGMGYVFVVLPVSFAVIFIGGISWYCKRHNATVQIASGIVSLSVCLSLSLLSSAKSDAIFSTHLPSFPISFWLSVLGSVIILFLVRNNSSGPKNVSDSFYVIASFAFFISTILSCNQQIVTGRAIPLYNFQSFGLMFTAVWGWVFLSAYLVNQRGGGNRLSSNGIFVRKCFLFLISAILCAIVYVNVKSFYYYIGINSEFQSYVRLMKRNDGQVKSTDRVATQDPYAPEYLPIWYPKDIHYILNRNKVFASPIPQVPLDGKRTIENKKHEQSLFEYAYTLGYTPDQFRAWYEKALRNKGHRFIIFGFLFSHMEFWPNMSNGLGTKIDMIAQFKEEIVKSYENWIEQHKKDSTHRYLLAIGNSKELDDNFGLSHRIIDCYSLEKKNSQACLLIRRKDDNLNKNQL